MGAEGAHFGPGMTCCECSRGKVEEEVEANQESMDPDYRCPRRGACRWRLWQKESGLCTADAAATVPGAYCLVDSQSQCHSSGPGEHVDLEDRQIGRAHV